MTNNKKSHVIFAIILLAIVVIGAKAIFQSPKTRVETNPAKDTIAPDDDVTEFQDSCDTARDLVFKYQIQNQAIEKNQVKKDYGEFVKVNTLKDFFFANGQLSAPGGYTWDLQYLDYGCQIKVILTDNDSDPIWKVTDNKIICVNSTACNITPELRENN